MKTKREWQDERIADIILWCADEIRSGRVPEASLLYEIEDTVHSMRYYEDRHIPCASLVDEYLDKYRPSCVAKIDAVLAGCPGICPDTITGDIRDEYVGAFDDDFDDTPLPDSAFVDQPVSTGAGDPCEDTTTEGDRRCLN